MVWEGMHEMRQSFSGDIQRSVVAAILGLQFDSEQPQTGSWLITLWKYYNSIQGSAIQRGLHETKGIAKGKGVNHEILITCRAPRVSWMIPQGSNLYRRAREYVSSLTDPKQALW